MTKARDLANGGFGLVLMKPSSVVGGTDNGKGTVTFSGASSVSLNDVFNTNYDNYFLTGNFDASASSPEIRFRFRVSGSDNSSAQYRYQVIEAGGTTTAAGRTTGATWWYIARGSNTVRNFWNLQINSPFISTIRTTGFSNINQQSDGTIYVDSVTSAIDVTTSYTGFTIFPETGTFSGTISVYGYNK
jgi:hypothetical protein